MSTSTGPRGGVSALTILENTLPRFGSEVAGVYAFPSFKENLKDLNFQNEEELQKLIAEIQKLKYKITP